MGAAIGPGDWIECIDATGENNGGMFDGGFLVEGRVYRVEAAAVTRRGEAAVRLVGQPKLHGATGKRGIYTVRRFRPIYRPRASFIESLKAPPKRQKTPVIAGAKSREDA